MSVSCRGNDADKIETILRYGPEHGLYLSLWEIAKQLNRGVRYVHSICQGDDRFVVVANSRRVGNRMVTLAAWMPGA